VSRENRASGAASGAWRGVPSPRSLLLLAAIGGLALLGPAYAASISLSPAYLASAGSTSDVPVACAAAGCSITGVSWVTGAPAGSAVAVSGARVIWTPASAASTYIVYVSVIGASGGVLASGSTIQAGGPSPVTTQVSFSAPVDPSLVASVTVDVVSQ
jgi:hypothetical protein